MTFRKIWMFVTYFLSAKKIWHWPKQSEVLIFDAFGEEILSKYLGSWKYEILHVREEQINMPVLIASSFKKGNRMVAYIDCFIEHVRPQVIVTFIDNNTKFYSLAVRHKSSRTLFIQNGTRTYFLDAFELLDSMKVPKEEYKVDQMGTFGANISKAYSKYIQGTGFSLGSLKNNQVPKSNQPQKGTIAFISQYRETPGFVIAGKFCSHEQYLRSSDELVLKFLYGYAEKNNKEVVIVPCYGSNKEQFQKEMNYYKQLLGRDCTFSNAKSAYSSYDAVDSAEVVVSIDSTLGYESAARGNKTALFSIRSRVSGLVGLTFGWPGVYPDEGFFWTNLPDTASFERVLDRLFAIDKQQWESVLSENGFDNIMMYDPGNTLLTSILTNELNPN